MIHEPIVHSFAVKFSVVLDIRFVVISSFWDVLLWETICIFLRRIHSIRIVKNRSQYLSVVCDM
jgi:hypothetical protein